MGKEKEKRQRRRKRKKKRKRERKSKRRKEKEEEKLTRKGKGKKKEFWFQTSLLSIFTGDPQRQLWWYNWRGDVPPWAAAGFKRTRRLQYLQCWFSYSLSSPSSAVGISAFDIMSYTSTNHRKILEAEQTRRQLQELGGKCTLQKFFVSLIHSCYWKYWI